MISVITVMHYNVVTRVQNEGYIENRENIGGPIDIFMMHHDDF